MGRACRIHETVRWWWRVDLWVITVLVRPIVVEEHAAALADHDRGHEACHSVAVELKHPTRPTSTAASHLNIQEDRPHAFARTCGRGVLGLPV